MILSFMYVIWAMSIRRNEKVKKFSSVGVFIGIRHSAALFWG